MTEAFFGISQYVTHVKRPLLVHTLLWFIGIAIMITLITLSQLGVLGNADTLIVLLFVIGYSLFAVIVMTIVSSQVSRKIGTALKIQRNAHFSRGAFADVIDMISFAFSFTILGQLERFWKSHTERPLKHIIMSHVCLYGKEKHKAYDAVMGKLAYWLYLTNTDIGFPTMYRAGRVISYVIILASTVGAYFWWQDPGIVVIVALIAFITARSLVNTRILYHEIIHATLLTACVAPIFEHKASTQPMYVYEGLAPMKGVTLKLFDKPVEWTSFTETAEYLQRVDGDKGLATLGTQKHEERTTQRVIDYIRQHYDQGYPVETLRSALIEAGNSAEDVNKWIATALDEVQGQPAPAE